MPVDGNILQAAVMATLEDFPVFQSVVKRGLFWYYLEKTNMQPFVREEYREACAPLFDKNVRKLLFEVTWYKCRINLEVHHILSDGAGAIEFLRALVINYLGRAVNGLNQSALSLDYDASEIEKQVDSFKKYYEKSSGSNKGPKKPSKVYRPKGTRIPGYKMNIMEGTFPLDQIKETVKSYNTTITVFFVALLIQAIGLEMLEKEKSKAITINVPVNLRQFFPSSTARNFFGIVQISYNFKNQSYDLEDIIAYVAACLKNELTKENLARRMNKMGNLENNIMVRSVPLALKDVFMKAAYDISNKKYSASISNVGAIKMPEQLYPYIDMFSVFVSSDTYKICVCSYRNNVRLTFTTPYEEAQIQKHFYRRLAKMGIKVIIETNDTWEDET